MQERRQDAHYQDDKKYILSTLERTVKNVDKLYSKFEDFKVDNAKSITAIQTKISMSVLLGSAVFSGIFSLISGVTVFYITKG